MRFLFVATLLASSAAQAYGSMIRHEYTTCSQCHVDPSGGSILTAYGRAQGEVLLRTRYGPPAEDVDKAAGFLFGLFEVPEPLLFGGDLRLAFTSGAGFKTPRVFPMQADVVAAVKSGRLVTSVSLGLGSSATDPAKVFGDRVQLVSRHHWVGFIPDEDESFLIRVGRIGLPYGLRLPQHPLWVRASTQTDLNVHQQHGVALAYSGELLRGEVMGIIGNLQLAPSDFRERGYSAYLEARLASWAALGASSLITHAERALTEPSRSVWRHAHGIFGRLAPWRPLVISLEANLLHQSLRGLGGGFGFSALGQLELELTQGLHLVGAAEAMVDKPGASVGLGGWVGAWWFFAPHANVRVDLITRKLPGALESETSLFAQLHLFL